MALPLGWPRQGLWRYRALESIDLVPLLVGMEDVGAEDLFRETFGDDFTNRLAETSAAVAQHVAPHLQAAMEALGGVSERCATAEPVRSAVSSQLSSMAQEASAVERRLAREAARVCRELEELEAERRVQEQVRRAERTRLSGLEALESQRAMRSSQLVACVLLSVALRGWLRHAHTLYWALEWLPQELINGLPMALASWARFGPYV